MPKYGVFSGSYFPAFGLNTAFSPNAGKYGPEKTPYLDTFHAVMNCMSNRDNAHDVDIFPDVYKEKGTEQTKHKPR